MKQSSFMLTVNEIIKNYLDDQNHPHNTNTHNYNEQIIKHNLHKLKSSHLKWYEKTPNGDNSV